ncbi:MAG: ABC transporter permease [Actinomycetota bacterium]|nr:ABC transporter permease [Actinomycetota bacterium]
MARYVVRRIAQAIPLLLGISIVVFLLMQMTPGGPFSRSEGGRVTPEQTARLRGRYGLDDPIAVQYLRWLRGVFTGDWGDSYSTGRPVLTEILDRAGTTLLLGGLALVLTLAVAIPIGVRAARRPDGWFDRSSSFGTALGFATPGFWLALMLLYLFSYQLDWLPSSGLRDLREDHSGLAALGDRIAHLVLPVIVLAATSTAGFTRYVRSSMRQSLSTDFVRTARGAGLPERKVVYRYALRDASVPLTTVGLLLVPELLLGSAVIEMIFGLPGLGRLFIDSTQLRDYPVLLGLLMISSGAVVVANMAADISYNVLDPRIRHV